MFFRLSEVSNRIAAVGSLLLLCVCTTSSLKASQWSCAIGDAKSVQRKTSDIAERLNEGFPHCAASQVASQLDSSACQLLEMVKLGAPWHQLQQAMQRTSVLVNEVNGLVHSDSHTRTDRRTQEYILDLNERVDRLRCNLEQTYAKSQQGFPEVPRYQFRLPVVPPNQHRSYREDSLRDRPNCEPRESAYVPQPFDNRDFYQGSNIPGRGSFPFGTYGFEPSRHPERFETHNPGAYQEERELGPVARIGIEALRMALRP